MNIDEFKNKLDDIRHFSKEKKEYIVNASPVETLQVLKEVLSKFKSFIPDFFSQHGASENIRYIYSVVRENKFPNATIVCIDTNHAASIYHEYNKGMLDFITEIITDANYNCDNIDKSGKLEASLKKAFSKDKEFIKSIFGGENNIAEERSLPEALLNIEALIDFIYDIDDMIKKSTNVINCIENHNKCELINRSVYLLYKSITRYTYYMIKNIINIYGMIDDVVKNTNNEEPIKPVFNLL